MADPEETPQDYTAQAQGRVELQYKQSAKLLATIAACVAPIQALEDAAVTIPALDDLDIADGVNLDVTADLVGQGRELVNGDVVTDDQLRLLSRARIARNHSHATGPEIIEEMAFIFSAPIRFNDPGGMSIDVQVGRVPTADEMAVLAGDILPRPEGVRLFTAYFSDGAFGFDGTPGATTFSEDGGPDVGTGFAEDF